MSAWKNSFENTNKVQKNENSPFIENAGQSLNYEKSMFLNNFEILLKQYFNNKNDNLIQFWKISFDFYNFDESSCDNNNE